MTKNEKIIANLAINKAEEICKSINGFNELNDDAKAIAIIFASISILNSSFKYISKIFNK